MSARRIALGVGIVVLVVLLQIATQVASGQERARVVSNVVMLMIEMPALMTALTFGFAWATRRRFGPARTVLLGILAAGVIGAAAGAIFFQVLQHYPSLHSKPGPVLLGRTLAWGFTYGQLHFGLWALAFVFPFAVEDARVRSLEADKLRLEAEKQRSLVELARLRAHLEPHFLLNTLNAIAGLVTDDPKQARKLLVNLGELLRDAVREDGEMQTLHDQMAWLRRYAEILEARHAGDLVFRWEIAGETEDVMLPRLLLQPLIENAVKHGALRRRGGGKVVVKTALADSKVVCTIEDNGPGVPAPSSTRSGAFGLHAVRRRLELKYAERASLRLESSDAGTRSVVEVEL